MIWLEIDFLGRDDFFLVDMEWLVVDSREEGVVLCTLGLGRLGIERKS